MISRAATFLVVLFLLAIAAANLRCVPPTASAGELPDWAALLGAVGFVLFVVFGSRYWNARRQRGQTLRYGLAERGRRHGF